MTIQHHYALDHLNTFGIHCQADSYVEYTSLSDVTEALQANKRGRVLLVGAGSNLLFLRPTFHGMVLHCTNHEMEVVKEDESEVEVKAGAGWTWDDFVAYTLGRGWYGLENLSYIPGTTGASAVQNVGAFGAEAGEFITEVECVDLRNGGVKILRHDELDYAYRHSFFKREEEFQQWAILSVTYRLSKHFTPRLTYGGVRKEMENRGMDADTLTAESLRSLIIDIRKSKLPEPDEVGSAGSFFKNPIVSVRQWEELKQLYPTLVSYPAGEGMMKIGAGWLIDQCGWKGKNIGRAGVYEKQALVIVNRGGATGQDIVKVCEAVQADVFERFGIQLQPEVNFIGEQT